MDNDYPILYAEIPSELADYLVENDLAEKPPVMRGGPVIDFIIAAAQCASTVVTLASTPLVVRDISRWIKQKLTPPAQGAQLDDERIQIKGPYGEVEISLIQLDTQALRELESTLKQILLDE